MINIQSPLTHIDNDSVIVQNQKQKTQQLQSGIRSRQIQSYRQKIRQQREARYQLSILLEKIPKQLEEALEWCRDALNQFNKSDVYEFPTLKVIQLFRLVQRFPCPQTIEIFRVIIHKISIQGIHQLFQFDVIGLLHRIIAYPQKVTTKTLSPDSDFQKAQIDLVKNSIIIIAILCQKSQRARNFIVVNHKTFLCVKKAEQKFGNTIRNQYVTILCSFVNQPMHYDEQYIRIIKKIIELFCQHYESNNIIEIRLLAKALTNVIKNQQKWAVDLIESVGQYDIIQQVLKLYKTIRKYSEQSYKTNNYCHQKQLGTLCHEINMFVIYYLQISTNQTFDWQSFFEEWFYILNQHNYSFFMYFTQARQDIYFILCNHLSDIDETVSCSHIINKLILQFNCMNIFTINLQQESNRDCLQQLSRTIGALFSFGNIQDFGNQILRNCIMQVIFDIIFNKQILHKGTNIVQILVGAIANLLRKCKDHSLKHKLCYTIHNYTRQLQKLSNIVDEEQSHMIDFILTEIQKF